MSVTTTVAAGLVCADLEAYADRDVEVAYPSGPERGLLVDAEPYADSSDVVLVLEAPGRPGRRLHVDAETAVTFAGSL